jgi:hypothetical protein
VKRDVIGRVGEESQHTIRAPSDAHANRYFAGDQLERQSTRHVNRILDRVDAEERRIGKHDCSAGTDLLKAHASLVEASVEVDEAVRASSTLGVNKHSTARLFRIRAVALRLTAVLRAYSNRSVAKGGASLSRIMRSCGDECTTGIATERQTVFARFDLRTGSGISAVWNQRLGVGGPEQRQLEPFDRLARFCGCLAARCVKAATVTRTLVSSASLTPKWISAPRQSCPSFKSVTRGYGSPRMACIGSILVAARAGTQVAVVAIARSAADARPNVNGSRALTP